MPEMSDATILLSTVTVNVRSASNTGRTLSRRPAKAECSFGRVEANCFQHMRIPSSLTGSSGTSALEDTDRLPICATGLPPCPVALSAEATDRMEKLCRLRPTAERGSAFPDADAGDIGETIAAVVGWDTDEPACWAATDTAFVLLFGREVEAVATAFWNRGFRRLGPRPEPNSSGSPVSCANWISVNSTSNRLFLLTR